MMPPFVVFPTNRIAHFVEVSLYLFYLAQRVNLTVQEHFWLVCKVENYTQEEAQKAISFYTNKLHMQEYLNYYPSALSKGTLQRS